MKTAEEILSETPNMYEWPSSESTPGFTLYDEHQALAAIHAYQQQFGWRPIEEAPIEIFSEALIGRLDKYGGFSYFKANLKHDGVWHVPGIGDISDPTHFMIPEPPSSLNKQP